MMSFRASLGLVFSALAFITSGNAAESPAELYWKSKLDNITMPKVLKASLQLGSNDDIVKLNQNFQVPQATGTHGEDMTYVWGSYHTKLTHNQVPQDGRVLYFTDDKLSIAGTKMKLLFKQIHNGAKFLPSHFTKNMDLASNNLQVILNMLSVKPKSITANYIERMLKYCAQKGIKGEVRFCATSLEAIVDYVTGKNKYLLVSTEEERDVLMEYTIQEAHIVGKEDNHTLVCHKLYNPYAVFLCHSLKSTDVYSASLVDGNGKEMKTIAVCHKDTSNWYPGHLALQILKLKPGSKHVCHFLTGDSIVWLRN